MELWQRALLLWTVLGVSVQASQETDSHLARVIERLDVLTNALQYQDNLLLASTIKTDDIFKVVTGLNQTLNDHSDIMTALRTLVDRNHEDATRYFSDLFRIVAGLNQALNDHSDIMTSLGARVDRNHDDATSQFSAISAGVAEQNRNYLSQIKTTLSALRTLVDSNHEDTTSHLLNISSSMQVWTRTQLGNTPLRLVGSSTRGRLEVFHDNQWGTVCDDNFTDADAAVFCRALGLPYSQAKEIPEFGGGTGPIHLDEVSCPVGNNVGFCVHNGWGTHNCIHNEDLGLYCRD